MKIWQIVQLRHCHQRLGGVFFLLYVKKFENSFPVTGLHLWVCFGLAAYLKLFGRFSLELNGSLWQSLAEILFHDIVVMETEASKRLLEFYVSHRN